MVYDRTHGRKKNKGAITVEYAMIFPLVIFCVIILIYLGMIYYQQALMQSIASENAENWAMLWGYDAQKVESSIGVITRDAYQSEGLYWQFFSSADRKKDMIRREILEDYRKRSLLKTIEDAEVNITYQNYLLFQKVGVEITAKYPSPMKSFFQSVGLSGDIKLRAYSETTVHDPKEFIHNVDYLLQIYEESGAKEWVQEKLKPLKDTLIKVKDFFK